MRLFFAIWPPIETAQALEQWARALDGRAMPAANIHLTLAFLGDADPARASAAAARIAASRHDLPIDRAGYWRHNKIVWAGPHRTPAPLAALAAALRGALGKDGFVLEERPFAAHVTLVRKAPPPGALPELPRLDWPVAEMTLVSSRATPGGSAYEVLERFSLGPG